ncbi:unnamed protein product [Bursaphelenchus xylophilus]|uniref:(pine wood nematode) hypothetical protein n=1 Tax=Bursaphelenchus xylophilus TaxID=6326 RepID=A0A1I7S714_BURXY|nr:unnamed protein product [Bursaphelenchus xylophilus]CAG9079434.1 unnamed protein product [Bursaphelenchus xylophilus]
MPNLHNGFGYKSHKNTLFCLILFSRPLRNKFSVLTGRLLCAIILSTLDYHISLPLFIRYMGAEPGNLSVDPSLLAPLETDSPMISKSFADGLGTIEGSRVESLRIRSFQLSHTRRQYCRDLDLLLSRKLPKKARSITPSKTRRCPLRSRRRTLGPIHLISTRLCLRISSIRPSRCSPAELAKLTGPIVLFDERIEEAGRPQSQIMETLKPPNNPKSPEAVCKAQTSNNQPINPWANRISPYPLYPNTQQPLSCFSEFFEPCFHCTFLQKAPV